MSAGVNSGIWGVCTSLPSWEFRCKILPMIKMKLLSHREEKSTARRWGPAKNETHMPWVTRAKRKYFCNIPLLLPPARNGIYVFGTLMCSADVCGAVKNAMWMWRWRMFGIWMIGPVKPTCFVHVAIFECWELQHETFNQNIPHHKVTIWKAPNEFLQTCFAPKINIPRLKKLRTTSRATKIQSTLKWLVKLLIKTLKKLQVHDSFRIRKRIR